jgi:UDP-glucose 4-epimerase
VKCLILGGGGFIGSHLTDALLGAGHELRILDRPRLAIAAPASIREGIEWCEGDFTNEEDLKKVVTGCQIVFHLISTTLPKSSNESPIYDVETNLVGTLRLLNIAVTQRIKKVLFISSGGTIYGVPKLIPIPEDHPTNPEVSYGIVKLTIEKYLKLFKSMHGLDYKVLRVSNPYGERQRVAAKQGAVSVFLSKALRKETIEIWGDGSVVRDYIYIADVVEAFLRVMDYQGEHEVFNIGSGVGKSLNQIIADIEELIGERVKCRYLPSRSFDVPENVLDISLAKDALHWAPKTTFHDGLKRTLVWVREAISSG